MYVFFTLFGYWVRGRGSNGIGTQLAYALFPAYTAQKSKFLKLIFFDIVITSNDHPRYVKHVLARIYVVFTLFWVCVAWGRFSARWTCRRQQNCCCVGCLVTLELFFSHFNFFPNPAVAPRMGLGDNLVTIRVLERPWGPTWWPLGPSSPSHGPPTSFQIAVCRWFNGFWCVHKLLSTLHKSKMENFAKKITSQRLLDQS